MDFWEQFPKYDELPGGDQPAERALYKVNAHLHSPYSFSAFESVSQALELARDEEIALAGINDFFSMEGYEEWVLECCHNGVFPLFNIEFVGLSRNEQQAGTRINDPSNPGRIYLSGKGLSYPSKLQEPYASHLLDLRRHANEQVEEMCGNLNTHLQSLGLDIALTFSDIVERYTLGLVRERHLARALRIRISELYKDRKMQEAIWSVIFSGAALKSDIMDHAALENEIRGKLLKAGGAAYVPEQPQQFPELDKIRRIILEAGGIPTYPLLADSVNGGYTEFEQEPEALYNTLLEMGIWSVEFIPGRNSTKALEAYASYFTERGVLVSFGSEHNTPELLPLELRDREGNPLSPLLEEINDRGACIIAAHQYLVAKGREGFLDKDGKPGAVKPEELKKIGEQVIGYFRNKHALNEYTQKNDQQ